MITSLKLIPILLFSFCIQSTSTHAQETICDAKFEADAGPDIDVCESGQVNLYGTIGGDANYVKWSGGKGEILPTKESLQISYTPTPEEYGTEVTLILEAGNSKLKCPTVKSEVHIHVNNQPIPDAGANQRLCSGNTASMKGSVKGRYKEIIWKTNGSGSFDNKNKLDAVYTPSILDIAQGGCSLEMLVIPYGVCLPDSAAMILMIDIAPELTTESEKAASANQPVNLSLKAGEGAGAIIWSTKGSGIFTDASKAETVYKLSPDDISKGIVRLEVSVSSIKGSCVTKKPVTLHIAKK